VDIKQKVLIQAITNLLNKIEINYVWYRLHNDKLLRFDGSES